VRVRYDREHLVAAPLVDRAALLDRVLRAGQRGDPGTLERLEDPGADVIGEELDTGHDPRVPDDEAEPPARHPVALRHGEHLDADFFGAPGGEEALGPAPVEDEVGVGEVVHDGGAGLLGEADGVGEDALRRDRRARIRGVVEVEGGDVLPGRGSEVGREARVRIERDAKLLRARERNARAVVRVAGIGKEDGIAVAGEADGELDDGRLRPRDDGDLCGRVDGDAVDDGIALGDGLLELGKAPEGWVAVHRGIARRLGERFDDVLGGRDVGVAAPEDDDGLALDRRSRRDASEEHGEVLLGKAI
jgi:hypothetical protein